MINMNPVSKCYDIQGKPFKVRYMHQTSMLCFGVLVFSLSATMVSAILLLGLELRLFLGNGQRDGPAFGINIQEINIAMVNDKVKGIIPMTPALLAIWPVMNGKSAAPPCPRL
jgi:hypothetical protein